MVKMSICEEELFEVDSSVFQSESHLADKQELRCRALTELRAETASPSFKIIFLNIR